MNYLTIIKILAMGMPNRKVIIYILSNNKRSKSMKKIIIEGKSFIDLVITKEQEKALSDLLHQIVIQSDNNRTQSDENSLEFSMIEHGFHGDILSDVEFLSQNFIISENNPSHWTKSEEL
jgi:hypothetical protein